ncbi:hypothetical protein BLNAU_10553 [Blattamonas nauphoetae]|uniref:Uncharacterized protein n=1 Tax=Blattamonas nauphoetae TaxID=2049346 RepID=A0ABQ9XQ56_9EUKA|nr:hypothetical protein BLNAU_10553 [Blattamonas nauphoetae]
MQKLHQSPESVSMGTEIHRDMFFIFALLSASNFRTPNDNGDKPSDLEITASDTVLNTGTITVTFAKAGDVGVGDVLTFTFTPKTTSNAAGDVELTYTGVGGDAAKTFFTLAVAKIGETGKFQWNTEYTLSNFKNAAVPAKAGSTTLKIKFEKPILTVAFQATTKSKYTATFSIAKADDAADTDLSVVFTAGKSEVTIEATIEKKTKSVTVEIEIVAEAAAGKLVKETEYTIECEGYICEVGTFTPADNSKLTGSTKQAEPAEGKKADGAVDKITLTLVNALLPATLPTDAKNTLKLTATDPAASNADYTLDKGEKFEWKPSAGSLDVVYLFNDCKIKAKSTVTATLAITDALTFTDQAITYDAGAKSVASVVAALIAVLALVF